MKWFNVILSLVWSFCSGCAFLKATSVAQTFGSFDEPTPQTNFHQSPSRVASLPCSPPPPPLQLPQTSPSASVHTAPGSHAKQPRRTESWRDVPSRAELHWAVALFVCVWNQCAALEAGTRSPLLQGCGEQTTERWPISVWPHGSLHLPPFNLLLAPERKESSTQATHLLPDPGMPAPRMHSALHYSLI